MTIVFSLLISSNIFSCFLIKFVNHRNNIGLLYWEISMLITTLQIHQGIMMQVKKLYSFLENNNLAQLIAEPTRVTCHSLTILDLVTTTFPGRFSTSGTLNPPSSCDHSVIFSNMNIFAYRSRSYKRRVWNFNNVDTTNMNGELDWISLYENVKDIDEIQSRWHGYFCLIIEKYIPLKTVTLLAKD